MPDPLAHHSHTPTVAHATRRETPSGRRPASAAASAAVTVRPVRRADLDHVIEIDATVTGLEKRAYWQRIYRRYGIAAAGEQRWFLVALDGRRVVGFLIGEVRDWEFGSPPCAWVFAINVDPARAAGRHRHPAAGVAEPRPCARPAWASCAPCCITTTR